MRQPRFSNNPRKPREQFIYIGCSEQFNHVEQDATSYLVPDDGREWWIFHRREYERLKKPKVLYALFRFFGAQDIRKDPIAELRRYDRVFAVDSNSKTIDDQTTVVTTVFEARWSADRQILCSEERICWTYEPETSKPEREGWRRFFDWVTIDDEERGCLFVDSEITLLPKINRGHEPVLDGFFIPKRWQLNYAGSDKADKFPGVKLIRACDEANKRKFQEHARSAKLKQRQRTS